MKQNKWISYVAIHSGRGNPWDNLQAPWLQAPLGRKNLLRSFCSNPLLKSEFLLKTSLLAFIPLKGNCQAQWHSEHMLCSREIAGAAKEQRPRVNLAQWGSPDGITCGMSATQGEAQ